MSHVKDIRSRASAQYSLFLFTSTVKRPHQHTRGVHWAWSCNGRESLRRPTLSYTCAAPPKCGSNVYNPMCSIAGIAFSQTPATPLHAAESSPTITLNPSDWRKPRDDPTPGLRPSHYPTPTTATSCRNPRPVHAATNNRFLSRNDCPGTTRKAVPRNLHLMNLGPMSLSTSMSHLHAHNTRAHDPRDWPLMPYTGGPPFCGHTQAVWRLLLARALVGGLFSMEPAQ